MVPNNRVDAVDGTKSIFFYLVQVLMYILTSTYLSEPFDDLSKIALQKIDKTL